MALETMKHLKEIAGFEVGHSDKEYGQPISPETYIAVDHEKNAIRFTIQNGPIKEVGVLGCQVSTMIHVAKHIVSELNNKYPCAENEGIIRNLDKALRWDEARTAGREKAGVEGLSKDIPVKK